MTKKNYQRRHLRAPFKDTVLYADGDYVLKGRALNISEGGLYMDEMPSFPDEEEVAVLFSLPQLPAFKNFTLLKMQTFSKDLFEHRVIRARAQMARKDQLSQNLDNIFRSRFGLQFVKISGLDQKYIDEYVETFASNLIYLQTLIDSFNTDDETKVRTRALAQILGYKETERISHLRTIVSTDYKSLQWS